jgi:D-proline reductase (dithiol) PrdB
MATIGDFRNKLLVQLFRRVPGLREAWARRHPFVEGAGIPWAQLTRPLKETTVALVTTGGVHLRSQAPFDMDDPDGDPSFREIPADAAREALTITHKYYDHSAADRDVNVVLPLDRLRELAAEGSIAGPAKVAYSFMGHIQGAHLATLMAATGPEVARRVASDGVGAVVLTPA